MGCCPFFSQKPSAQPGQYQILKEGSQPKESNKSSKFDEDDCQQIEVENDDFFQKKDSKVTKERSPMNKLLTIKDFHSIKILGRGGFGKVLLVEKRNSGGKVYAMKIIKKEMISQRNQQIHTKAQRKIMENMRCPFIVQLHYAFQSPTRLYLIMDFMIGGELFFHLRKDKRFNEQRTRLYAGQIVLALEYLHRKNTIYRDLKPENILMGEDGYLKITDFGLSKMTVSSGEKSYTFCGTPEYLAPEIYQNRGHDFTCDWWSLGALIYEMLSGAPPFYSKDKQKMLEDRLSKPIIMREYFTPDTVSLLTGLLAINPKTRLGRKGGQQIKSHPFFTGLDWDALYAKTIPMPFKPQINDGKDLGYFDKVFTDEVIKQTPTKTIKQDYDNFTYSKEALDV